MCQKARKIESEEKAIIVPDSDMPQMLELLDGEFKIIMINVLRALMVTVDSMQKQMGNISRGRETVRKSRKEMLKLKSTVTEIKNDLMASSVDLTVEDKNQWKLSSWNVEKKKDLWDDVKRCDISLIEILEGDGRQNREVTSVSSVT